MSSNLTIRHPDKSEFDCIADVWFSSWLSTGLASTSNVTKDDLRERLETEEDWQILIAEWHGQAVGMIALQCDTAKLEQLFVAPEHQNQGIGQMLLNAAKERLPNGMWLKAHGQNLNAIRFYQSQGFEVDLGRSDERANTEDVFYRWTSEE